MKTDDDRSRVRTHFVDTALAVVWNNEVSSCEIGTLMNKRLPGSNNIAFNNEKHYLVGSKRNKKSLMKA